MKVLRIITFRTFLCLLLAVLVFGSSLINTHVVLALSKEQKKLYNKNILYYDYDSCSVDSASAGSGSNSDVDKFLKALAHQESGGDPRQPGSAGGARGKYQYIDSTWQARFSMYGPAGEYSQANLAPEPVQDAVAYIEYAVKFKELNNDLFKLAVSHFYPAANSDKGLLDVVPPANVITPRQYAEKLIDTIKNGGAWEKIPLKYNEAPEFDEWAKKAGVTGGNPGGIGTTEGGAVYMVGDSITVRANRELKSELESKKFKPYINGAESRSITGDGSSVNGLEAVERDKERIKNASRIVVALGTNQNNDFEGSVKDLVRKIRGYNSDAQIYWVNVFSKGHVDSETINKTIEKVATSEKFNVIDTSSKNIPLDPDKVHQKIPEGSQLFAKIISESVAEDRSDYSGGKTGTNCKCGSEKNSAEAIGSNNTEIAFNFLVGKGLKPMHAAAMVGNFIHESGGDPIRTNNPNPSSGANGIAHWLGGRLTSLYSYADSEQNDKEKDWNNIHVQLDYLWKVDLPAQTKGGFPALETLQKTDNIKDGVEKFEALFERSGDTGSYGRRTDNAKKVLADYGSDSLGKTSSSDSSTCSRGENGQVTGEYSLPVDRKYYKSNPEWFSKTHHDHPGADIPVGRGTPIYSISSGTIIAAPNQGGYGFGVTIDAGNGIWYEYGHGIDGGSVNGAKQGDKVKPGQLIMHTNNTGSSLGDHLHFGIRINGVNTCPQKLLVGIGEGNPPDPKTLPTSGCSH